MSMKAFLLLLSAAAVLCSCNDITKGYLEVDYAEYTPDTLYMASDPASTDSVPYQSGKIQGVIGTFPIYYGIEAVKDGTGIEVFAEISSQIRLVLNSMFQIEKNHTIPVGTYTIDLRVWNLGRSFVLPDVYTLVVSEVALE